MFEKYKYLGVAGSCFNILVAITWGVILYLSYNKDPEDLTLNVKCSDNIKSCVKCILITNKTKVVLVESLLLLANIVYRLTKVHNTFTTKLVTVIQWRIRGYVAAPLGSEIIKSEEYKNLEKGPKSSLCQVLASLLSCFSLLGYILATVNLDTYYPCKVETGLLFFKDPFLLSESWIENGLEVFFLLLVYFYSGCHPHLFVDFLQNRVRTLAGN